MMRTAVSAVQHIRKVRGGSQAHLLRASDGHYYITKFQNNPGGVRALASEFLATKLALFLGLPMAEVQVIDVPETLIAGTPALRIEIDGSVLRCASGLQLGSRYAGHPGTGRVFDHLPQSQFRRVANRSDVVRMLAFDKWTGNCDGRQAVFVNRGHASGYHITFIDQHYCFDGERWSFPDLPLFGMYHHLHAYQDVTGWESFEPVLSRIEQIDYAELWRCAAEIPHEWLEYDGQGLFDLVEALHRRRSLVRELITQFRNSDDAPFPNWRNRIACSLLRPQPFLGTL